METLIKVINAPRAVQDTKSILEIYEAAKPRIGDKYPLVKLRPTATAPKSEFAVCGFQGCTLVFGEEPGQLELVYPTDLRGNPNGSASVTFTPDPFTGLMTALMPLTPFNLDILINAYGRTSYYEIADASVADKVKVQGEPKLTRARKVESLVAEFAEKVVHKLMAVTIKALHDKFGDAYKDLRDYKQDIYPMIEAEMSRLKTSPDEMSDIEKQADHELAPKKQVAKPAPAATAPAPTTTEN